MKTTTISRLFASALVLASVPALAADLEVEVVGLRSDRGDVHLALYDRADGFATDAGKRESRVVAVAPEGTRAVFRGLAPGRYAIAAFHDENRNGAFDQGFLGVPLEGYGFSRDAMGFLSAPEFAAAAVEVAAGGTVTRLTMRY